MTAPDPLELALADIGPAVERIESIRKALDQKRPTTPRSCELIAEHMDEPLLGDFLATEAAPGVGRPLAAALRAGLLANGDLPDAARLRALVAIEGEQASDVLAGCLRDGSPLLRELAIEMVADGFLDNRALVGRCQKLLTPVTSMPLESYFKGRLFSVMNGLAFPAAARLLGQTDARSSTPPVRGFSRFFETPPPPRSGPDGDESPAGPGKEDAGPVPDLPVERLLQMLNDPINPTDLVSTIRMLGHSGDPRVLEPLMNFLYQERILDLFEVPSSHVHDTLVEAIVRIGGPTAGRPLGKFIQAAANDNDFAFFAALNAIHTHRLSGALPFLVERLRRPGSHPGTPGLLVAAIGRIGGSRAARLTFEAALATDTPKEARPHFLKAFSGLADHLAGDRQSHSARLREQIPGAREGSHRTALLEALAALGGDSAGVVLQDRLRSAKSPEERAVAFRGLGRVDGPGALECLLDGLDRCPPDPGEALAIVSGLAALGDDQAVAALASELDRESRWAVRLAIIDALGEIGSPLSLPRLEEEHARPAYAISAPSAWARLAKASLAGAIDRIQRRDG